jgi:Flp pilus assembly pilin Flp
MMHDWLSASGESERGSVIDFALILILFSIVLITIAVLLGPSIADFFGRLVVAR